MESKVETTEKIPSDNNVAGEVGENEDENGISKKTTDHPIPDVGKPFKLGANS